MGPPRSVMVPEKELSFEILSTSLRTDLLLLEVTTGPWCLAIAQKEQFPKQPLTTVMESFIISQAGTLLKEGCGRRVKGSSYRKSISLPVRGLDGGCCKTNMPPFWAWTRGVAAPLLALLSI